MKTRETKQKDLVALTESLQNAKSAMVVSFSKLTVNKDIEFRNHLREAGARYQVVKNTLARIAAKDTQFEQATEHFKGVTAIAWTENDPVILAKSISKFMKDNADIYTFKTGVVDGRLVDLRQVQDIASLPSKEELISKMLWVLNAQAQRIVTVINAVPRDLAIVIKQIGDKIPESGGTATAEAPAAEAAATDAAPEEAVVATEEAAPAATEKAPVEVTEAAAPAADAPAESAPAEEVSTASADEPAPAEESSTASAEEPAPEAASEEAPAAEGDEKAE